MAETPRAAPVTLLDVARAAGVSLATASRALNGSDRKVREDLRRRVQQAAADLDYTANASAQAMARGHTDTVGVVVADIADPYFSTIVAGIIGAAEEQGLVVTLASVLRRPEREVAYVTALRRQRPRAVVLVGSRVEGQELQERLVSELAAFERTGGRVALVSQPRLPFDTVDLANRAGARSLAQALVGRGYRRFAVLAGPDALLTARDRLAGFRAGLAEAGVDLPADRVVHGDFTRDGGYAAAQELLRRELGVQCLFAVNDVMAVGAMAALRDAGVRVPREVAVAGFDDIVTLRDVTPSLSTVRLPLEEVGAMAVRLVLQPAADHQRLHEVAGEVVLRESTPDLHPNGA